MAVAAGVTSAAVVVIAAAAVVEADVRTAAGNLRLNKIERRRLYRPPFFIGAGALRRLLLGGLRREFLHLGGIGIGSRDVSRQTPRRTAVQIGVGILGVDHDGDIEVG